MESLDIEIQQHRPRIWIQPVIVKELQAIAAISLCLGEIAASKLQVLLFITMARSGTICFIGVKSFNYRDYLIDHLRYGFVVHGSNEPDNPDSQR